MLPIFKNAPFFARQTDPHTESLEGETSPCVCVYELVKMIPPKHAVNQQIQNTQTHTYTHHLHTLPHLLAACWRWPRPYAPCPLHPPAPPPHTHKQPHIHIHTHIHTLARSYAAFWRQRMLILIPFAVTACSKHMHKHANQTHTHTHTHFASLIHSLLETALAMLLLLPEA